MKSGKAFSYQDKNKNLNESDENYTHTAAQCVCRLLLSIVPNIRWQMLNGKSALTGEVQL